MKRNSNRLNNCSNIPGEYNGRRIIERRLDREEVSELVAKRNICVVSANVTDEKIKEIIKSVKPESEKEISTSSKESKTPQFYRRVVDRRLEREEFEYLIRRNKKQL
ncbi:MAG: hypothetical protein ACK4NF_00940 [Planctomycetota bacterium]